MRRPAWTGALLLILISADVGLGDEPTCRESPSLPLFKCISPAGGWDPYGCGLLRWWDPRCFPKCGGPDDYCRKCLPRTCWPPYPSYFIWGSPENCCPNGKGCQRHDQAR
jgi:hypothetical protein